MLAENSKKPNIPPETPVGLSCQKLVFQPGHQHLVTQSQSLLQTLQQLTGVQPDFQSRLDFFTGLCNTLYQHFETENKLLSMPQAAQAADGLNPLLQVPRLADMLWHKEGEHAYLQGQLLYFQQQLIALAPKQADTYTLCLQQLKMLQQSLQTQIDEEQRLIFPHLLAQQAKWQANQLKALKKC